MKTMMRMLAIAVLPVGLGSTAFADDTNKQQAEYGLQQVYFGFDSVEPVGDLLMAANHLQCSPTETIILDAYADPTGTETYNADLAKRRAEAVRDRLVAHGISKARIVLGVFGETNAGENHAQDRRVEIRMSPESVATLIERRKLTAVSVVTPTGEIEARATIPVGVD